VTGHCSYEASQLPCLNRLVALKHLGFSLDQVGQLLEEGVGVGELRGMLRLIESEGTMPITDIEVKNVAPQRVLGLHTIVPAHDGEQHVEPLFERVIQRMEAAGADRASPFSRRQRHSEDAIRLFAGYIAPADHVPGLEAVTLAGTSVASVVRRGAVGGISEAHQALDQWAESQGLMERIAAARWREIYLETNDDDYSDWLIEVQVELTGSDES
jgi:effector-binding domain-containing protein